MMSAQQGDDPAQASVTRRRTHSPRGAPRPGATRPRGADSTWPRPALTQPAGCSHSGPTRCVEPRELCGPHGGQPAGMPPTMLHSVRMRHIAATQRPLNTGGSVTEEPTKERRPGDTKVSPLKYPFCPFPPVHAPIPTPGPPESRTRTCYRKTLRCGYILNSGISLHGDHPTGWLSTAGGMSVSPD